MEQRNVAMVMVLMVLTCGLYGLYHTWTTTEDVMKLTGKSDINTGLELIANLLTCGLFGMFIEYRNQKLIDDWYIENNINHQPRADSVGLLNLATLFVGLTWLVATFIYQKEVNALIALQMEGRING